MICYCRSDEEEDKRKEIRKNELSGDGLKYLIEGSSILKLTKAFDYLTILTNQKYPVSDQTRQLPGTLRSATAAQPKVLSAKAPSDNVLLSISGSLSESRARASSGLACPLVRSILL